MTRDYCRALLDRVSFRDLSGSRWNFELSSPPGDLLLRVVFIDADNQPQTGRKWYISPHMSEGEFLQTAMLAVLTALEHEARESFLVDGLPIFGPHIDPAALAKACGVNQRRAEVSR